MASGERQAARRRNAPAGGDAELADGDVDLGRRRRRNRRRSRRPDRSRLAAVTIALRTAGAAGCGDLDRYSSRSSPSGMSLGVQLSASIRPRRIQVSVTPPAPSGAARRCTGDSGSSARTPAGLGMLRRKLALEKSRAGRPDAPVQRQADLAGSKAGRPHRLVEQHEIRAGRGAGRIASSVPSWPRSRPVSRQRSGAISSAVSNCRISQAPAAERIAATLAPFSSCRRLTLASSRAEQFDDRASTPWSSGRSKPGGSGSTSTPMSAGAADRRAQRKAGRLRRGKDRLALPRLLPGSDAEAGPAARRPRRSSAGRERAPAAGRRTGRGSGPRRRMAPSATAPARPARSAAPRPCAPARPRSR